MEPPAALKSSPDGTQHSERHHITVSMVWLVVRIALTKPVYAKMPCSSFWWSITQSFLAQICIALEAVFFKLHTNHTPGWVHFWVKNDRIQEIGPKVGVGALSWVGIFSQDYGTYIRHKWRVALSAFENFADIIEVLKPSSSTTVALCCNLIHYCRCFASLCYFFPLLPLFCKVLMALQTLLHKTSDFHSTFSALCCASSLFLQGERAYDIVWGRHQKIWSYQGQIQRTFRETPKCNFRASKIQQSKTGTGQTCPSLHHHTVHTHRTLQLRNIT